MQDKGKTSHEYVKQIFQKKKYQEIGTEYILKDNGRNISRIDERHKFLYWKATQNT